MLVCTCVNICMVFHESKRSALGIFIGCYPPYFWGQSLALSQILNLSSLTCSVTQLGLRTEFQGSACVFLLGARTTDVSLPGIQTQVRLHALQGLTSYASSQCLKCFYKSINMIVSSFTC